MIRISLPWLIEVINSINNIKNIETGNTRGSIYGYLYIARTQVQAILQESLYSSSIFAAREVGDQFIKHLDQTMQGPMSEEISEIDVWSVKNSANQLRTVLLAELGTFPCFFVLKKLPYDTNSLLEHGETIFPAELGAKVPDAVFDAKEAGKSLAFELGTACGFHSFRTLESVVRAYYREKTGGAAEPKQRNLGVYIRALEKHNANEKIISALKQIKDLHRNPVSHPEVALTIEEAASIVGVVRSAIAAMINELPEIKQTTSNAP